jgi:predicted Rossmann fold flavoprotein
MEKKIKENEFDVAIIGAGPAGIMAAIIASNMGRRVILIEKNSFIGKKFLFSGGGRCNFTNAEENLLKLTKNYNNGEFLFHAFSIFGPKQTIKFFNDFGIETKVEENGRIFPKSESAKEVLGVLNKVLSKNKVKVLVSSKVIKIDCKKKKINKIVLEQNKEKIVIKAKNYILCTGGKSYNATGSDGQGYDLAKDLGHTINQPFPALCPVMSESELIKELSGVSLKDIEIKEFNERGDILFTHFGISGPVILNLSGKLAHLLQKGSVVIYINFFPKLNQNIFLENLINAVRKNPSKNIKNILSGILPERLAEVVLKVCLVDDKKATSISKKELDIIVKNIFNFKLIISKLSGFEQAMVTKGGICLNEIDHKTMKSKIISNLFFAGEIIDVDGKTGGFNLQLCWTTGYLVGMNCN